MACFLLYLFTGLPLSSCFLSLSLPPFSCSYLFISSPAFPPSLPSFSFLSLLASPPSFLLSPSPLAYVNSTAMSGVKARYVVPIPIPDPVTLPTTWIPPVLPSEDTLRVSSQIPPTLCWVIMLFAWMDNVMAKVYLGKD